MGTSLLLGAAGAAAAGALAGPQAPGRALWLLAASLAAVALGAAVREGRAGLALVVVAVGLASMANSAWRTSAQGGRMLPALDGAGTVRVCGQVLEERPRSLGAEARLLHDGSASWVLREPLLVAGERLEGLRPGMRFCARGRIRPARDDIRGPPLLVPERIRPQGVASPLRYGAALVRDRFRAAALGALPERQAGLLLGMTQGDRGMIVERDLEAFRTTGLAHLVAVSGFHVAIVLGLVVALLRAFGPRSRWLRTAAALPVVVFFAFLAGLTPSVLRATVTAAIVLTVTASGRASEALRVGAAALLLLVLAAPGLVTHPGFQMSFGATFGIILWARPLAERLQGGVEPSRLRIGVSTLAGTALAAQAGVAPFVAAHFGRLPALAGLANLVAVPIAPVVVGGGIVALSLASVWEGFGWAPAALRLPLDALLAVAHAFASLPGAGISAGPALGAALTAGIGALVVRQPRLRYALAAVALVCASLAGGGAAAGRPLACGGPEVRAVDVGQGTAVLLRSDAVTVLADGGPGKGRIADRLRELGVGRFDALIASHPHADHTEGLVEVLRTWPVGVVIGPATIGWGVGKDLVAAAEEAGVPVVIAAEGDSFSFGEGLALEVLAPAPGPLPAEDPGLINRYNLVVRARVQGSEVLLPGDADSIAQLLLLDSSLKAPLLVAPHHGSADLDPGFVDAVSPDLTLVTVGPNRYGHPTPTALDLYARHGPVFRTDTDGSVAVCVIPGGMEVLKER